MSRVVYVFVRSAEGFLLESFKENRFFLFPVRIIIGEAHGFHNYGGETIANVWYSMVRASEFEPLK